MVNQTVYISDFELLDEDIRFSSVATTGDRPRRCVKEANLVLFLPSSEIGTVMVVD